MDDTQMRDTAKVDNAHFDEAMELSSSEDVGERCAERIASRPTPPHACAAVTFWSAASTVTLCAGATGRTRRRGRGTTRQAGSASTRRTTTRSPAGTGPARGGRPPRSGVPWAGPQASWTARRRGRPAPWTPSAARAPAAAASRRRPSRPQRESASGARPRDLPSPLGTLLTAPPPRSSAPAGAYDPAKFEHLSVSKEVKDLFKHITRYQPQNVELRTELKCFIPDYLPAVGEIDPVIKVRASQQPRPAGCCGSASDLLASTPPPRADPAP